MARLSPSNPIDGGPAKRRPFAFGLPVLASLVVLAAVATMMALGFWQIGRAREKEALLARYQQASGQPPMAFPVQAMATDKLPLFRRSSATCLQPVASRTVAGRNARGESGFSHWVDCRTGGGEGPGLRVDIGWSARPAPVRWSGGPVSGILAPDKEKGMRLVAEQGFAGLQPSGPPDLSAIPNNHRSYAFQWFAFAAAALIIFGLAVRNRRPR